jgi:hypothetical protein
MFFRKIIPLQKDCLEEFETKFIPCLFDCCGKNFASLSYSSKCAYFDGLSKRYFSKIQKIWLIFREENSYP